MPDGLHEAVVRLGLMEGCIMSQSLFYNKESTNLPMFTKNSRYKEEKRCF